MCARLTFDDALEQLDGWSRDGKWVYFSSSAHDLVGRRQRRLSRVVRRRHADAGQRRPLRQRVLLRGVARRATARDDARAASPSGQWWRHGHSHHRRSGDLAARPDRRRRAGGMARADQRRRERRCGRCGQPTASRCSSCPTAAAPRTSGRLAVAAGPAAPADAASPTAASCGRRSPTRGDVDRLRAQLRASGSSTSPADARARSVDRAHWRAGRSGGRAPAPDRRSSSDLALSPDGKKVAFTARGEVFAAVGEGRRRRGARHDDAGRGSRSSPGRPTARRLVYSSERDGARAPGHLRLRDRHRRRSSRAGDGGDYAPRFSPDGKSIAFVRGGTELRVIDVASKAGTGARQGHHRRHRRRRPPARLVARRPLARVLLRRHARVHQRVDRRRRRRRGPPGQLPRQRQRQRRSPGRPTARSSLFDTGQRTEPTAARPRRPDRCARRSSARISSAICSTRRTRRAIRRVARRRRSRRPRRSRRRRPSTAEAPASANQPNPRARAANRPQSPWRSSSTNIRQRLSLVPTGLDVGEAFISPDGKTAVLIAGAAGQQNLYSWSLDELARERPVARQLTTTAGAKADVNFSPDSKEVFYLDDGRDPGGHAREPREPRARRRDRGARRRLRQGEDRSSSIRPGACCAINFFDPKFNGVDWHGGAGAGRAATSPARGRPTRCGASPSLMIGELNASHLGINRAARRPARAAIGHLGLDFDRAEYESSGRLRITAIVPLGPAALGSGIQRGEYLLAVDGEAIGRQVNLDALLDNKVNRRVAPAGREGRGRHGRRATSSVAADRPGDRARAALPAVGRRAPRLRGQGERRPARLRPHGRHVGGVARAAATSISMPTTSRATASSSTCATTTAGS